MTPEAFAYWLQGFLEVGNPESISRTQIQIIQDHLDLVFNKVTPDRKEPEDPFNHLHDPAPILCSSMEKVDIADDKPFEPKKGIAKRYNFGTKDHNGTQRYC